MSCCNFELAKCVWREHGLFRIRIKVLFTLERVTRDLFTFSGLIDQAMSLKMIKLSSRMRLFLRRSINHLEGSIF